MIFAETPYRINRDTHSHTHSHTPFNVKFSRANWNSGTNGIFEICIRCSSLKSNTKYQNIQLSTRTEILYICVHSSYVRWLERKIVDGEWQRWSRPSKIDSAFSIQANICSVSTFRCFFLSKPSIRWVRVVRTEQTIIWFLMFAIRILPINGINASKWDDIRNAL